MKFEIKVTFLDILILLFFGIMVYGGISDNLNLLMSSLMLVTGCLVAKAVAWFDGSW